VSILEEAKRSLTRICDERDLELSRTVEVRPLLPDKPDFLSYRLLGGLTEAINTCFWLHKDLLQIPLREYP
jgi:hypothetical protein